MRHCPSTPPAFLPLLLLCDCLEIQLGEGRALPQRLRQLSRPFISYVIVSKIHLGE